MQKNLLNSTIILQKPNKVNNKKKCLPDHYCVILIKHILYTWEIYIDFSRIYNLLKVGYLNEFIVFIPPSQMSN